MTTQATPAISDERLAEIELWYASQTRSGSPPRSKEMLEIFALLRASTPTALDRLQLVEGLEELLQEAADLLAERKHGNSARSPGHNARLKIEAALALLSTAPQASATAQEPERRASEDKGVEAVTAMREALAEARDRAKENAARGNWSSAQFYEGKAGGLEVALALLDKPGVRSNG